MISECEVAVMDDVRSVIAVEPKNKQALFRNLVLYNKLLMLQIFLGYYLVIGLKTVFYNQILLGRDV